ncbi:MAG: hypothetical protein ABL983_00920 [Nitrospira sp.]
MKCSSGELARAKRYREAHKRELSEKVKWKWANDPEFRRKKREYIKNNEAKLKVQRAAYAKIYRQKVVKTRKIKVRQFLWDYLLVHPCIDCGENNPVVLEFDHVRDIKKFAIAYAPSYTLQTVEMEIAKCDVRCANCHRKKTFRDFGHSKHLREDQLKGIV